MLPWPQIAQALLRRAERRAGDLAVLRAISCQPRLEVRLVLMLWHLAARWGRVEPAGLRVTLPLTHRLLGQLVAAERPSITHALARLSRAGLVTGKAGDWHLHGSLDEHIESLIERTARPGQIASAARDRRRHLERRPVSVLWITSGLGCDGDSIAMTAATNPSLEDLLRGALPGMPPIDPAQPGVRLRDRCGLPAGVPTTPSRAISTRSSSCLKGSVPNEEINGEGHWAGMGVDAATGQPILTNSWIDRLAPKAAAVLALGTCAAYGGVPAMRNNPTGAMGLRDYLGWDWRSRLGVPIVNLPGCPVQPDNITETLLCLVLQMAAIGPALELDEQGRPRADLRPHRARELRPRRLRRAGRSCPRAMATAAAW